MGGASSFNVHAQRAEEIAMRILAGPTPQPIVITGALHAAAEGEDLDLRILPIA